MKAAEAETARDSQNYVQSGPLLGVRHLQCLLLFLSLASGYAMRANLFAAIVAITDKSGNPNFKEYYWSEETKSYILSSFFWGYCITQIPGGHWAIKYGAKNVLLIGIIISTVFCFLTPLCVQLENLTLLCILRMIQGLSQGVVFPTAHAILSNWAPLEERGALCAFCYSGTFFGVVIMYAMSGFVAASPLGWPGIFYICGALSFAWIVAWILWGANTPNDYKGLTADEKILIESSLKYSNNEDQPLTGKPTEIPWLEIFTSVPVWILVLVHCAHNYGFVMVLIELPTYLNSILDTDIKSNALFSALPYLAMLLLSLAFSLLSNVLAKRNLISINANRKLLNTIGQWVPAVGLLILGVCMLKQSQLQLALFLLIITVGMNSASLSGFQVNHIDLAPNFASVLMGITHCAANLMSVIAPLVVGWIVKDEKNPYQWATAFSIASVFYFVGNLLFLLCGSTEVQPWNEIQKKKQVDNDEETECFDV